MTKKELFLSMLPPEILLATLCNQAEMDKPFCYLGIMECPFNKYFKKKCYEVTKEDWKTVFDIWDNEDDRKD